MNDIQIENLLRKAPRVAAPAGLLETLVAQIKLYPGNKSRSLLTSSPTIQGFFQRWFPAISFAAFLLTCVVVVGLQTNWLSQLRSENKTLRAASQNLDELRRQNAEYQRLLAANQELERLRKDALEVPKLRAEVEQLRAEMEELKNLRAENQQLLAASNAAQKENEEEDPFAAAKKKGEMTACINNLKQIGLAVRVWAQDENDKDNYPSDFLSMSNELGTTTILICPSDEKKTAARDFFSTFGPNNVSYEMLSPGISSMVSDSVNIVYARCPIHNSVVCVDGHVEILGKNSKVVIKDGVAKINRDIKPEK